MHLYLRSYLYDGKNGLTPVVRTFGGGNVALACLPLSGVSLLPFFRVLL